MYVIAIDSGGSKVVGAVVDQTGLIVKSKRYEILERNGDYLVDIFKRIVSEYSGQYPISAVGISGNGRIDSKRGIILNCGVHTNWEGRSLKDELENALSLPVCVNNDCYSAIKGEIWKGPAQAYPVVSGIIIGTGVGGALVSDGKFWHGGHYGAGEVGHMILHRDGLECYCGQCGCVEQYVSGTALWKNYNKQAGRDQIQSGYQFFEAYNAGDPIARNVLERFIDDLSIVMCNIANLNDPDAFLIGGGISETHSLWDSALEARYREHVGYSLKRTAIVYASMGNSAALLGAAKFAFEMLEQDQQTQRRHTVSNIGGIE